MRVPLFIAINSEPQTPAQNIDYTFAREELMLNELSNDPIQRAIARLEKQHEEDKQVFLGIDDFWRRFSKISYPTGNIAYLFQKWRKSNNFFKKSEELFRDIQQITNFLF